MELIRFVADKYCDQIKGVSEEDIKERLLDKFPSDYLLFLRLMGRQAPEIFSFDHIEFSLYDEMYSLAQEITQYSLGDNVVVFLNQQGYAYYYFDRKDTSEMLFNLDGEVMVNNYNSFSKLFEFLVKESDPDLYNEWLQKNLNLASLSK